MLLKKVIIRPQKPQISVPNMNSRRVQNEKPFIRIMKGFLYIGALAE